MLQMTWRLVVRVGKRLGMLGLVGFSLALVFPETIPVPFSVLMAGMDGLLLGIALRDLRDQRIPNQITYPLMAAGIVRAVILRDPTFAVYWAVLWILWSARFMGGGDAKLLMGLFALWPDLKLAYVVAASILVTGIPYLAYKYRAQWRTAPRALGWRLLTLQILPSSEEFQKEAVPYAFSFCLAGGMYLFMRFISL